MRGILDLFDGIARKGLPYRLRRRTVYRFWYKTVSISKLIVLLGAEVEIVSTSRDVFLRTVRHGVGNRLATNDMIEFAIVTVFPTVSTRTCFLNGSLWASSSSFVVYFKTKF